MKPHEQNIVSNLRASQNNLAAFSDEEILAAYKEWAVSEDYPDETKIAEWIPWIE